jgi:ATP-dependent DNA ligase
MRSTFHPCLPTAGKAVPASPKWFHEIKYDGYRLIVVREADRVRLFTRNGYDWSGRYPWIVESALRNRQPRWHFRFQWLALASARGGSPTVRVCGVPLSMRKTNLAQLLRGRPDGIFVAPFEQGEIGPDLFRAACNMGLEGMVSKRADRPYRAGRCTHWIKVKNRKHPAIHRGRMLSHDGRRRRRPMPIPARCAFNGCKNESVRSVDHRLSSVLCGVTHL